MKSFILTIFLGILLVAGSTLHMYNLKSSASELIEHNEMLTEKLHNNDFKGALASIDELHEKVCDIEPFFAALGNHDEMNIIEQNLAELKSFTEGGQKYDAISKAYVLSFLFEHLPKNLQLRLENIF